MSDSAINEFDTSAAITRSLLGWGVLAGPIYLAAGIIQGALRDGFDFSRHQLSLMMLDNHGWIQMLNLILAGVMVAAAAVGTRRAMRPARSRTVVTAAMAVFAVGLLGSGLFPPDPMAGYPIGAAEGQISASGILHLVFGLVQFIALALACFATAHHVDREGSTRFRRYSTISGIVILVGFLAGAALSFMVAGVIALWIAVIASFAWIAVSSIHWWNATPHPDLNRRAATATA